MVLRHLAEAERHIAQGETHLAKQSALIAELERHGHDTRGAQAVLTTMRETQALHQQDRGGNCKSKSRRSRANTFGCQYSKPQFDFSVGSLGMFECVAQRNDPRCRKLSLTNRRCHQARDAPAAAPHPALLKAFGTSALKRGSAYLNARNAAS
jgi:hypothetical protein